MNKSELIHLVARDAQLTIAAATQAVDAVFANVVKAVAAGETVTVPGFGAFKPAERAARTGRNPQTGEAMEIAATVTPKFSAGAGFKAAVAQGKIP